MKVLTLILKEKEPVGNSRNPAALSTENQNVAH